MSARSAALLLVGVWLVCASRAQARPRNVHFSWQRPAASLCPTRDALQADVEQQLGRRVFGSQAEAQILLRGSVEDGADGVRVWIEARDERGTLLGTRELTEAAGQCAALRGAIGLVLTLFVEYQEPPPAPDVVVGLGAELSIAQAPLPRLSLALGPGLFVAIGAALRLDAVLAYWPPVSIQTQRGTGATLQAVSLELRGCARVWAGLGLCAGVADGALIAAPLGLEGGPARRVRLLSHAVLQAGWVLPVFDLLHVELAGGGQLSLSRPAFSYTRADGARIAVYRPQRLGLIARLSVIIPTE